MEGDDELFFKIVAIGVHLTWLQSEIGPLGVDIPLIQTGCTENHTQIAFEEGRTAAMCHLRDDFDPIDLVQAARNLNLLIGIIGRRVPTVLLPT